MAVMIDYFIAYTSKYDGWVFIGAWTAIRLNTVVRVLNEVMVKTLIPVTQFEQFYSTSMQSSHIIWSYRAMFVNVPTKWNKAYSSYYCMHTILTVIDSCLVFCSRQQV